MKTQNYWGRNKGGIAIWSGGGAAGSLTAPPQTGRSKMRDCLQWIWLARLPTSAKSFVLGGAEPLGFNLKKNGEKKIQRADRVQWPSFPAGWDACERLPHWALHSHRLQSREGRLAFRWPDGGRLQSAEILCHLLSSTGTQPHLSSLPCPLSIHLYTQPGHFLSFFFCCHTLLNSTRCFSYLRLPFWILKSKCGTATGVSSF